MPEHRLIEALQALRDGVLLDHFRNKRLLS